MINTLIDKKQSITSELEKQQHRSPGFGMSKRESYIDEQRKRTFKLANISKKHLDRLLMPILPTALATDTQESNLLRRRSSVIGYKNEMLSPVTKPDSRVSSDRLLIINLNKIGINENDLRKTPQKALKSLYKESDRLNENDLEMLLKEYSCKTKKNSRTVLKQVAEGKDSKVNIIELIELYQKKIELPHNIKSYCANSEREKNVRL